MYIFEEYVNKSSQAPYINFPNIIKNFHLNKKKSTYKPLQN